MRLRHSWLFEASSSDADQAKRSRGGCNMAAIRDDEIDEPSSGPDPEESGKRLRICRLLLRLNPPVVRFLTNRGIETPRPASEAGS